MDVAAREPFRNLTRFFEVRDRVCARVLQLDMDTLDIVNTYTYVANLTLANEVWRTLPTPRPRPPFVYSSVNGAPLALSILGRPLDVVFGVRRGQHVRPAPAERARLARRRQPPGHRAGPLRPVLPLQVQELRWHAELHRRLRGPGSVPPADVLRRSASVCVMCRRVARQLHMPYRE